MKNKTTLYLDKKEIDKDGYTVKGIFSTENEDRHGDIVLQEGWELKDFMANPVILFGHNHWDLPIGKMVKLGLETIDGKKALVGTIKFAVEEYEMAKTVFNLYAGGFMKAFSVGFRNLDSEVVYDEETDEATKVMTRNLLLEVSCVPIPANAEALVKAESKGINIDSYKKELAKHDKPEKKTAKNTIDGNKIEGLLTDVVDSIKELSDNVNNKATDVDAQDNSDTVATPQSKGSDTKTKRNAQDVLRGKAVHKINRAIRTLSSVKGKL